MDYLIDTHALIWYAQGDKRLPEHIKKIILAEHNSIFVSYAAIWEMTIKISIGKLVVQFTLPEWEALLTAHGFSFIPL